MDRPAFKSDLNQVQHQQPLQINQYFDGWLRVHDACYCWQLVHLPVGLAVRSEPLTSQYAHRTTHRVHSRFRVILGSRKQFQVALRKERHHDQLLAADKEALVDQHGIPHLDYHLAAIVDSRIHQRNCAAARDSQR